MDEPGSNGGDDMQISSIVVHRLVQANNKEPDYAQKESCPVGESKGRGIIAKRAAQEINLGDYVVLGCGLPKAIEYFAPDSLDIHYVYPETGIFGGIKKGKPLPRVTDGCLVSMGLRKNSVIVKASDGFCAIRGSHMNNIFVEAYQVSERGDLANIEKGDKALPAPGSQIDLAEAGPKTPIIALMELESEGKFNLLKKCA